MKPRASMSYWRHNSASNDDHHLMVFLCIGRECTTWHANNGLTLVVQKVDNAIHRINHHIHIQWIALFTLLTLIHWIVLSSLRTTRAWTFILVMHNWGHASKWQIASPALSESDWNMKTNVVIAWLNNYWTRLFANIVICQCIEDQLFFPTSSGQ